MFSLGRKIDLHYKSNLIIVLSSLITAVLGWLVTGELLSGISLGGGVFLTWALSRELDPPHDYSALIAAVLSLSMLFQFETVQFFIVFWLLLFLRAVNGISGKELTLFDVFAMLAATVYLALSRQNSIYSLVLVLAVLFIRQTGNKSKTITVAGALSLAFFIIQTLFLHPLSLDSMDTLNLWTLLVIVSSGAALIIFRFISRINIEDDKGNRAVPAKVFASQLLYTLTVLLLLFFDEMTFNTQIIYLSINLGITLHFIGSRLFSARS